MTLLPSEMYRNRLVQLGTHQLLIQCLIDNQQLFDPTGQSARAGVPDNTWSLFGMIWPSGVRLAEVMATYPIAGLKILELGCGLGLASLIIQKRGGNITASDYHPQSGRFLLKNAHQNQLPPVRFIQSNWEDETSHMGTFDLIIASDILYEPAHSRQVCEYIQKHAGPDTVIIMTDPNRRQQRDFIRRMEAEHYQLTILVADELPEASLNIELQPFSGKVMQFAVNGPAC